MRRIVQSTSGIGSAAAAKRSRQLAISASQAEPVGQNHLEGGRLECFCPADAVERKLRAHVAGADLEGQAGRVAALGHQGVDSVELPPRFAWEFAGGAVGVEPVDARRDETSSSLPSRP